MSNPDPAPSPSSIRRTTIESPAGRLAALEARPTDSTPVQGTAVFVPGFNGSKEDAISLLPPIVSMGYCVVSYDQRGQYESDGPTQARAYSIETFMNDLQTVVAVAGESQPVHLVGHSFGGLVARYMAITAPQSVKSLALLDSGPDGASLLHPCLPFFLSWLIRIGGLRAMAEVKHREARRSGVAADRLPWLRHALASEPDRLDELLAKAIPLIVICGEDDYIWSAETQAKMAEDLAARLKVIMNAGHNPNDEQPQATADALLEFWASVDGRC